MYAKPWFVSAKKLFVSLAFVRCSWYALFVDAVKDKIRQARISANLTQAGLAAAVGVTTRTVQNWESGARTPWRHLEQIAEATDKPLPFFLLSEEGS
jgi:DNA-binding XRE family transcriptional regulator